MWKEIDRNAVVQFCRQRDRLGADRCDPDIVLPMQSLDYVFDPGVIRKLKLHRGYAPGEKAPQIAMHGDFDADHFPLVRNSRAIFSAVIGRDLGQKPVAAAMALPIAAGGSMQGGSPTPLAP